MIGYNEEKSKYEEIANDFNAYKEKQKTIIKNVYRTKAENKVGGDTSNIYIPKIQPTNQPKCPLCQSTNIKSISTINRVTSVAVVGLASSKIGKQWECKNCGNKF